MSNNVNINGVVGALGVLMNNAIQQGLPGDFKRAKGWIVEPRSLQDQQHAIRHLHEVIDYGMTDAIPWLAFCYERGIGVKRDKTVARCLYRLAKLEGSKEEDNLPKNVVVSSKERGVIRAGCPQYDKLDPASFKPQPDDLYFDIETSGLENDAEITTVCWFYHGEAKYWHYSGEGVRPKTFISDCALAKRIVTYNGDSFDIPRVNAKWGIAFPKVSIDLRHYVGDHAELKCYKMKYVAQKLGIPFHFDKDFSGAEAVSEWYKVRSACARCNMWDDAYFTRLVKYCLHDVYLTRSLHYLLSDEKLPTDEILEAKMDSISGYAFYEPELPSGYAPLYKYVPDRYKERWPYVVEHPFKTLASSIVVITGEGRRITRSFAEDIVVKLGATLKPSKPTRDTDFCVVLGVEDISAIRFGTGKFDRARELQQQGSPIRIINEDQLIDLIEASIKEMGEQIPESPSNNKIDSDECQSQPLWRDFERLWNAILADGVIEPCEVEMLRAWISKYDLKDGPFLDMLKLIDAILIDGVVTYDEEMELYESASNCVAELKRKGVWS